MSLKGTGASHLSFVKDNWSGDDTIAIRMSNNNIDAKRYPGSLLPEAVAEEGEFGVITGEVLVTMHDKPDRLVSIATSKPILRGRKFEFNSAVFWGVQS
ncbi:MAG: hypothetical protein ACKO96_41880, partial [Flammeovirgaceae bacterium]